MRIKLYAASPKTNIQPTRAPAVAGLAQQGDALEPAEDLLDPFARVLAEPVAGVSGGPPVDGTASVCRVRRDMRRDPERAHGGHEVARVVGLVGGQRGS